MIYFTEVLIGYENIPGNGKFLGFGRPGVKLCQNSCRNPGYENIPVYGEFSGYGIFLDMEIFQDFEAKIAHSIS